jgi:SAM-dependent methyltransferase
MFLPLLEDRIIRSKVQVDGLADIFKMHEIKDGSNVLDLACGIGRHTLEFASRGYKVLGVDISPDYLDIAQKESKKRGLSEMCAFIVSDMRNVGSILKGKLFLASLSLFTSLGYYDEKTDLSIMQQLNKLSLEGGLLIIHIMCKKYGETLDGKRKVRRNNDLVKIEDSSYDDKTSKLKARWRFLKANRGKLETIVEINFENRLYSHDELEKMLALAGWEHLESYSDLDLNPFNEGSKYIVVVARKSKQDDSF